VREQAREEKVKKRKKVEMKSEKGRRSGGEGDDIWGVPTNLGAQAANLRPPCWSGLGGG